MGMQYGRLVNAGHKDSGHPWIIDLCRYCAIFCCGIRELRRACKRIKEAVRRVEANGDAILHILDNLSWSAPPSLC